MLALRQTGYCNDASNETTQQNETVSSGPSLLLLLQLPTLMYLQFCPLPDGSPVESCLMDDLRHLHSLLGSPPNVPFWLAKVEVRLPDLGATGPWTEDC